MQTPRSRSVVLDVGNCVPDFSSIKRMLQTHFEVDVLQAHRADDALAVLREQTVHLVLVNRKLDCDYSDGTEVLKSIKADPQVSHVPVMLVTNYAEHQQAAVALGAEYGFGKLEMQAPATIARLSQFLGS